MILQIIKKQALLFWRNPVQLLLLLGLPIILIAILGAALGNMMTGGEINLEFKMAVIEHQTESEQVEEFLTDLDNRNLPEEAIAEMTVATESVQPVDTLLNILKSEELREMIILDEVGSSDLSSVIEDESYSAVVEIPADFSYELLNQLFFDEGNVPELIIHHNEGEEIAGNIIDQLFTTYQEEFTFGSFLGERGIDPHNFMEQAADFEKEISSINQQSPINSSQYYTIGMVVMNVLFMATTIATFAFDEKKALIFDRMIVANISKWLYFIGILISGMLFSLLQIFLVFGFAYFVYGVAWPDVGAFLIISLCFAIAVGSLGVLLTAVSYSANSEQIISFFSGIIVTIFAFLGGSFFPIGDSSSIMQKIGDFTPNGAAMSAYLSILRGDTLMDNISHIIFIASFAIIAIIIGVLSFPKRGATA